MIGDILLINKVHKGKAEGILPKIEKGQVVTITGPAGVGKTEVATWIGQRLFQNRTSSFIVSIDDYYWIDYRERDKLRKKKGIDSVGLVEINWTALIYVVEAFKEKTPIRFQRVNKFSGEVEYSTVLGSRIDTLIIEGLYAGYLRKFTKVDFSIFLEATTKQTYLFRKQRMKENPDDEFRNQVVEKEARVVGQLKQYADEIIPFNT